MIVNALESPKIQPRGTATGEAPAKVNLTLEVLGRREDGFHELRSLVMGVDLRDRVQCLVTSRSGLTIECSDSKLGTDQNLTVRAADALARRCGRDPKLTIRLEKRIPVGAGLGGGSSDAATTLRLCDRLWNTGLGGTELSRIGAEIGSDVPFFFSLPAAVITGRGEKVRPVRLPWSGWVLLVLPDINISTAAVYRAWRLEDAGHSPRAMDEAVMRATRASDLSEKLINHLEPAAFRVCPPLARLSEELNGMGLGPLQVSGSGSALFRLFDDPETARQAAKTIEDRLPQLRTEVVSAPAGEGPLVSEDC